MGALELKANIERMVSLVNSGNAVPDVSWRRRKLKQLLAELRKNEDFAVKIMQDELGRGRYETLLFELVPLARCLKYLIKNIPSLARERKVKGSWMTFPARASVVQEPYGVVLVYPSWNYPFLLALEPVAGAVAAGNRVIVKFPERMSRSFALVKRILGEVFDESEVVCVGNELEHEELYRQRIDYIFYTGNPWQASEIIRLSAERIIPFTLELGGKNPCIVDSSANLRVAARRIVWGKFTNAGQTCIAPDYLLVNKSIKSEFLNEVAAEIKRVYGEFPLDDPGCGRIVDTRAYERLSSMCANGRLITGGEKKPEEKRISPTLLDQLHPDDPLLTQEVFGPLLGVVVYDSADELFSILRRNPSPLAVYFFGNDRSLEERLKKSFASGSLVINDCLTQFVNMNLPFGGVGRSGVGSYHGKRTFECFSHARSVMKQSGWFDTNLRYRGGWLKEKVVEFLFRH